mmetsp:Transcript_22555/g.64464  ORF Transcript_22555/g.64464 Transcript_22555/m.64464 type:complete len:196 (+) Transcript_22555:53-640(+)
MSFIKSPSSPWASNPAPQRPPAVAVAAGHDRWPAVAAAGANTAPGQQQETSMKKTRTNCIILSLSFLDGVWLFVVFFLPHLLLIVVVMVLVRDLSTAEWVLLRGMLAAHNKPNLVHDDLLVVELLDAHLAQVLLSEQMYLGAFEVLSQGGPVVRHIEMPLSEQLHPRTDTQTDRQTGSIHMALAARSGIHHFLRP